MFRVVRDSIESKFSNTRHVRFLKEEANGNVFAYDVTIFEDGTYEANALHLGQETVHFRSQDVESIHEIDKLLQDLPPTKSGEV